MTKVDHRGSDTAELHPSYSLQDINTEMISGVAAPAMLKYPVLEVSKKDRIPRNAPNPRNYGERFIGTAYSKGISRFLTFLFYSINKILRCNRLS